MYKDKSMAVNVTWFGQGLAPDDLGLNLIARGSALGQEQDYGLTGFATLRLEPIAGLRLANWIAVWEKANF